MKRPSLLAVLCAGLSVPALVAAPPVTPALKNAVTADPGLKSIGPISFGPDGLLLVAEPSTASIVAVDTGDITPAKSAGVEDVAALLAEALKTTADKVQIADMAANPASGKIYFSVRAGQDVAVVAVDGAGKATVLDLAKRPHVKVSLPKAEAGPIKNISKVAFANDRVLVTGQSNEEFSSKIFSIPVPLNAENPGAIFSAETYHVAHGRWETKAPIQAFIPYDDGGQPAVVGAFACTPIAKFPLAQLSSGGKVKGTSVVELGSGNRPLDLISYKGKDGKGWIVTNTQRFKEPYFGPSKYWGVRVSAEYLERTTPEQINEKAARRDVKQKAGPEGIEILDVLSGAVQIDKLNDQTLVVLRENGDKLRLETAPLP